MKIPTNIHQIKQTLLRYHNHYNRKTEVDDYFVWMADVVNDILQVMFTPLTDKLLDYETFSWLAVSCSPFFSDIRNENGVRFRVIISLRNSAACRITLFFRWVQEEIHFISGDLNIDKGKEYIKVHVKPKSSI